MRKTYSYHEALKILGGRDHPIIAAMDKLLGGALLAGSLGTWEVLDLFDAIPDFVRLSNELVSWLSSKRREVSRYTRTQQLHAAHTVLAITAFFEAVDEQQIGFTPPQGDVTSANAWRLHMALPSASLTYEINLEVLRTYYSTLSHATVNALKAVAFWDELDETKRDRVETTLLRAVPDRAVERYEELLGQSPAQACWWSAR